MSVRGVGVALVTLACVACRPGSLTASEVDESSSTTASSSTETSGTETSGTETTESGTDTDEPPCDTEALWPCQDAAWAVRGA
jgi:hypothetical protein